MGKGCYLFEEFLLNRYVVVCDAENNQAVFWLLAGLSIANFTVALIIILNFVYEFILNQD
jgi:hypothetical protein